MPKCQQVNRPGTLNNAELKTKENSVSAPNQPEKAQHARQPRPAAFCCTFVQLLIKRASVRPGCKFHWNPFQDWCMQNVIEFPCEQLDW